VAHALDATKGEHKMGPAQTKRTKETKTKGAVESALLGNWEYWAHVRAGVDAQLARAIVRVSDLIGDVEGGIEPDLPTLRRTARSLRAVRRMLVAEELTLEDLRDRDNEGAPRGAPGEADDEPS
jgi:ABC-type transporter Mla subunit MlaD